MWRNLVPSSPRLIQQGASLRSRAQFDCVTVRPRNIDGFDAAVRRAAAARRTRSSTTTTSRTTGGSGGQYCTTVSWHVMDKSSSVASVRTAAKGYFSCIEGTQQRRVTMPYNINGTRARGPIASYCRFLSSKDDEGNKENESNQEICISPNKNVTDPVFAEYLAGGQSNNSFPPGGTAGAGGVVSGPKRRKRKIVMIFEDEKELYKKIHRNQLLQKERSRQKTAASVYRALIGNVVICCGTFEYCLWRNK
jgi:hypothetical protein